jgi:predicted O-methyltransferase YrrM
MKKLLIFVLFAAAALAPLTVAAPEKPLDDAAIRAYLDRMHGQPGMMNVPRADGEFLHDFILEHNYKNVLEIGTSNGYSALWMAMALRRTGGKLTTLEIDAGRAALARENFRKTGLTQVIELREGDALRVIPTLDGPFDLVFIDAWKEDYLRYFELTFPKLRPGGAIVAHNVVSHGRDMQDFLQAVQNHPELETRIDRRSSAGLSVSLKRPKQP